MLNYANVTAAVVMFGIQFLFNKLYGNESGNGMGATFIFSFIGGIIGIIALMIINGPQFDATPFPGWWKDAIFAHWAQVNNRDDLLSYKEPTPNKTAIKAAIKSGQKISGASIVEKNNIQIK
jgi:hypothetical protein